MSHKSKNAEAHAIREELKTLKGFWHSPIDLGHGVITKNKRTQKRFSRRLRLLQIPENLSGKRVLDVGTWDGYFAFEMEKRGAEVLAIDVWDDDHKEIFLFSKNKTGSKIDHKKIDVHDIGPENIGLFDIVLCAGLLYHTRYPLIALEKIRSVTKDLLILETVAMVPFMHENYPMIAFFPGDTEAIASGRDWKFCAGATIPWIKEALHSVGFKKVEVKYTPSLRLWRKFKALILHTPIGGRSIFHAYVK